MYEVPPAYQQPEEPSQQRQVLLALPTHPVRVAWGIFALNIVMFIVSVMRAPSLLSLSRSDISGVIALIDLGAKYAPLMDLRGEWWRLASAMVLHAGLVHLGFNSYALYILGPEVERLYGWLRFTAIYLVAGLAGSVGSYIFGSVQSPAIGASGAIFGLIGATGGFSYASRHVLGEFARQNLKRVIGIAAINLLIGFSLAGIDNYAHVGGLIAGALAGVLLVPVMRFADDGVRVWLDARPSSVGRWIGIIIMLVALAAATYFVHTQRLQNAAIVQDMQDALDFLNK